MLGPNWIWQILFLIVWFSCGWVAGGCLFSFHQREFALISWCPVLSKRQRNVAIAYIGIGTVGLIVVYFLTNQFKHGMSWRPLTDEERDVLVEAAHPGQGMREFWRERRIQGDRYA